jgi:hypothetical protein
VALLDTGIDFSTPELQGSQQGQSEYNQTIMGDPQDPIGHGTHVAGIIAGTSTGYLSQLKLFSHPIYHYNHGYALAQPAFLYSEDFFVMAFDAAVAGGYPIINASIDVPELDSIKQILNVYRNHREQMLFVSTRNLQSNQIKGVIADESVIKVSNLTYQQGFALAEEAEHGATLSFLAPGTHILSALADNSSFKTQEIEAQFQIGGNPYIAASGTSMATPHVAGSFATIYAYLTSLNIAFERQTLIDIFHLTALDLYEPGRDLRSGFGAINTYQAMLFAHFLASHHADLRGVDLRQELVTFRASSFLRGEKARVLAAIKGSLPQLSTASTDFPSLVEGLERELMALFLLAPQDPSSAELNRSFYQNLGLEAFAEAFAPFTSPSPPAFLPLSNAWRFLPGLKTEGAPLSFPFPRDSQMNPARVLLGRDVSTLPCKIGIMFHSPLSEKTHQELLATLDADVVAHLKTLPMTIIRTRFACGLWKKENPHKLLSLLTKLKSHPSVAHVEEYRVMFRYY